MNGSNANAPTGGNSLLTEFIKYSTAAATINAANVTGKSIILHNSSFEHVPKQAQSEIIRKINTGDFLALLSV